MIYVCRFLGSPENRRAGPWLPVDQLVISPPGEKMGYHQLCWVQHMGYHPN